MRGVTSLLHGRTAALAALAALALPGAPAAVAQRPLSAAEQMALGDSAHAALAPVQALGHYRAALAIDSNNYAARWKTGRELVDIAKQIEDDAGDSSRHVRDSLYMAARAYGEAAVRLNPTGADGHFTVAQALGRLARTKGGKERVRFAKLIYDEGMKAIELDSTHDGAYHLIGAWHMEVMLLSGFQRFFAKTLFGGGFLDKGNWADAQRYLERAVALKPRNVFHRLELGEVYFDVGKVSQAREQFNLLATLPIGDVLDPKYQKEAKQILEDIKNDKDRT
jgi:tetratricopeptide (TPR) repeat protein